MDAYERAAETMPRETIRAVQNWVFGQGLTAMHYDAAADLWHISDGEAYSTVAIMRAIHLDLNRGEAIGE